MTVLADHYEDDWSELWWVRADGRAEVLQDGEERKHALDLLAERYVPYRERRPSGAVIRVDVERWTTWPEPESAL